MNSFRHTSVGRELRNGRMDASYFQFFGGVKGRGSCVPMRSLTVRRGTHLKNVESDLEAICQKCLSRNCTHGRIMPTASRFRGEAYNLGTARSHIDQGPQQ